MSVIYREDNMKIFRDDKTGNVSVNIYTEKVSYSEEEEDNNILLLSIKFNYWTWKGFAKAVAMEYIDEYKGKLTHLIEKSDI